MTRLEAALPPDVDTTEQARLTAEGKYPQVQRLFDELSWQSFIALNWPQTSSGQPAERLTDPGSALWETYSESYEVFKPDGAAPDPYGEPRTTLPPITKGDLPDSGNDVLAAQGHRVLYNLSSTDGLTVLDEVKQAFSSPLWDQNGNAVHYEVLLNQPEYDYINDNELYNLQGQVAYFAAHGPAVFPSGQYGTSDVGAIELKLAWRILADHDIPERYIVRQAFVVANEPAEWVEVTVGLVGMHISHKTTSSPQWIWSTFEHVDNLNVNDFEAFGPNGAAHPKTPSFYDPSCEYCPVNVVPEPDENGVRRTQVARAVEIPDATQAFNAEMQALLGSIGSRLQYYELINTQWPTEPTAPPAPIDSFPENITNKSGGKPTPVYLINSVMETYFQGGAAGSAVQLVVDEGAPVPIPSTNGGNTPLEYAEGFCHSVGADCGSGGDHLVRTTESCMGCHSSAGIAIVGSGSSASAYTFGAQLSADFSWLLQQKAQPKTTP
ncbi:hypothetical protein [Sorangium sp. So ce1078]|uniref:hypothetical protein n=1 Tax=Sorangium sp. So ce1078 TaxID=3133329 RepID=UPI003F635501